MTQIPLIDLAAQYRTIQAEVEPVVREVLSSGGYILGKRVAAFEAALAQACGCRAAVGVNCGTDALELALRACGIGPGDEVLVPAFTFMASALAVTMTGATPVLVDIDEASYGLDVQDAARRITPRTKAIMPVHLYGQACDVDGVLALAKQHRLKVIEDCAQAIGATYKGRPVGSFGDAGCLSFYPTKNLGAAGDGGAVVTNEESLAAKVRLLRAYGTKDKVVYAGFGRNSRLDELQAAILHIKLRHLPAWNAARRERAGWYRELFTQAATPGIGLPQELPERQHVYHLYVIRVPQRDRVQEALGQRGIHTMVHYARALHQDSIYQGTGAAGLSRSERAAREVLSIPMSPELTREAARTVAEQVTDVVTAGRGAAITRRS